LAVDSPFQKRVFLTKEERRSFEQLISGLEPELSESAPPRLKWPKRFPMFFWRHLGASAMLLPVGLTLMIVSVLTWWPLGILGFASAAIGMRAANALLADRLSRSRFATRRRARRAS